MTFDWNVYENFCNYVVYLENKKYKTEQEKKIEPHLRTLVKVLHDSLMSNDYPSSRGGVVA